jgi:hypothetical protein
MNLYLMSGSTFLSLKRTMTSITIIHLKVQEIVEDGHASP